MTNWLECRISRSEYCILRYMSPERDNLWRIAALIAILLQPGSIPAEPVTVRYTEGTVRGFLALRSAEGKILAEGDLFQTIHGERAVSRLVFHFKDGSVDDETSVFTQRGHFRLIRDHHIQRGPMFPKPMDLMIDGLTGQVTVRYQDKEHEKVDTEHLNCPADLANGIILNALTNISPDTKETKLSYVAATPKPRVVTLSITPQGEETFWVAQTPHKAVRFVIKVDLGGLTGIIAPLIGKQPADTNVWVSAGEVPAFVKSEGPLYQGGPIWSIETTSPVWRGAPPYKK